MRLARFAHLALLACASRVWAEDPPKKFVPLPQNKRERDIDVDDLDPWGKSFTRSRASKRVVSSNRDFTRGFLIQAGVGTNVVPSALINADLSVGYLFGLIGVELKATYRNGPYNSVRARPDNDLLPSLYPDGGAAGDDGSDGGDSEVTAQAATVEAGSELARPRSNDDKWSMVLLEPSLVLKSRFVPFMPEGLYSTFRFGIPFGWITDQANDLSFRPRLWRLEAGLAYHVNQTPFFVSAALAYTFGDAVTSAASVDIGRLPLHWTTLSIGLGGVF